MQDDFLNATLCLAEPREQQNISSVDQSGKHVRDCWVSHPRTRRATSGIIRSGSGPKTIHVVPSESSQDTWGVNAGLLRNDMQYLIGLLRKHLLTSHMMIMSWGPGHRLFLTGGSWELLAISDTGSVLCDGRISNCVRSNTCTTRHPEENTRGLAPRGVSLWLLFSIGID